MSKALLRLQSLWFEGAGLYRQPTGELPLANQKRVLICGPEGSGKSMIPEVPTVILYGKGAPRVQDAALKESSIVNKDTGYLGRLEFESGFGTSERHVSIEQAFKHRRAGSRYAIHIDGKRDETVNKPEQKKLVKRLAPLSFEEWLGVVYLHQGGTHDLLAGSPTDKAKYLTSVFGLDFYVDLITEAKAEMAKLTKLAETGQVFQQRLANIEEDLRRVSAELAALPEADKIEDGITLLSERLHKVAEDLGRMEATRTALLKRTSIQKDLHDLKERWGWDEDGVFDVVTKLKEEHKATSAAQAKAVAEMKALQTAKAQYDRAKASADRRQQEFDDARKQREMDENVMSDAPSTAVLDAVEALLTQAETLGIETFAPGKSTKTKWTAAAREVADAESLLERLRKLAKHSGQHCPTCTRPVTEDDVTAMVDAATAQRNNAYKVAEKGLYVDLKAAFGSHEMPAGVTTVDVMLKWVAEAVADVAALAAHAAAEAAAKARLQDALDAMKNAPKPRDAASLEAKVQDFAAELEKVEESLAAAEEGASLVKQLRALDSTVSSSDIEDLNRQVAALRTKRDQVNVKYQASLDLRRARDRADATKRTVQKQHAEVLEKLQEHADTALRLREYEHSIIPYFSALRAGKVNSCVGVLETVLPAYVGTMATNQYAGADMKLVVSEDLDHIDLLLRPTRFGGEVSALQASGGQRQRFTVAILGAVYETSPRKANVLFYDEPFGHMEGDGKVLVMQRLIPMMMDRCPSLESVFVISHDKEILESSNDHFDSVWTVDLDENGSRVRIGQKLAMVDGR